MKITLKGSGEMSKRLVAASIMVVMMSILLTGCFQGQGDDVVAIINGREVPRSELERYLDLSIVLYTDNNQFSEADQIRYLDFYINEQLFYKEALNRGLEVSTQEVLEEYQESREFLITQYFEEDEQVFQDRLESLDITEDDLRELIKRNILISKLIDQLQEGLVPVTEEELQAFYEENYEEYFTRNERRRIRHILVDSRSVAESLIVRIQRGEDFGELAQEFSKDPMSAPAGGEMNFVEEGDFVESFNSVAFSLPVGEISEVVETKHGFHILEVLEIKPAEDVELDESLKEDIRSFLLQERHAVAINSLLEELKEVNTENKLRN